MELTNINESHVSVSIGTVPNDHKCFVLSNLANGKVDVIKGYDERVRKKVCSMTNYEPSLIEFLDIGATLSSGDNVYIVTRIS